MAIYKYHSFFHHTDSPEYDAAHEPGEAAAEPGIYRCTVCGEEIGIARGHTLPPQNHHQHAPSQGPIRWKLLIAAEGIKH